jgi:hypothetical protein
VRARLEHGAAAALTDQPNGIEALPSRGPHRDEVLAHLIAEKFGVRQFTLTVEPTALVLPKDAGRGVAVRRPITTRKRRSFRVRMMPG